MRGLEDKFTLLYNSALEMERGGEEAGERL